MLCTLCPVVGSLPKFLQIFGRQSRNQGLHSPDVSRIQRYMIDRSNLPISTAERSEPRDIIRQSEPFSTDIELPWQCGTEYYWRDLGEMHFPRHIKEVRCLNATCWYGHYRCTPAKYTAMVLTRSVGGDEDGNVPYSLRQEWRFEHLDITIGCMCSR
ncbi:protein trunk-like [Saccostrea cucullata]|uniref:protein trunk-like n=1 Tax=Saccostrea cuccullata TaxID=36930 RepID=UPI002ED1FC0A